MSLINMTIVWIPCLCLAEQKTGDRVRSGGQTHLRPAGLSSPLPQLESSEVNRVLTPGRV